MNKLTKSLIITSTIALGSTPLSAMCLDVKLLERNLQTRVSKDSLGVGLVVGVIDGEHNKVISVGKENISNNKLVNKESLFEIGSITKTFTGILLADMVLKGELRLDDPVIQFLPQGMTMPTRNAKQITLLHLATHTSALPRLPTDFVPKDMANPYANYTVEMMYKFLSNYQLTRDIGLKSEYSNLGMGLLGHVLALKAGKSYEALVKERILNPLGMNNTTIMISDSQKKQLTIGHDAAGNPTSHWDIPTLAGAGALRSSGEDMMIYLAANMGLDKTSLSAAIELSHQYQHEFGSETLSIGLAWLTSEAPDGDVIWHNGGTGGYRSFVGFNKKMGIGVFVLANSQDDPDAIGQAILSGQIEAVKMVAIKEIPTNKKDLLAFVGEYQLAPNFTLTISKVANSLFAQATGQQKLPIFAKSKNEFFFKAVEASLTFEKNKEGKVDSLVLHQNGNHPAKKIR